MAHSFVSSFEREIDAFRAYVASFPDSAILLIDTYDTLEGARAAVEVAREMAGRGQRLIGVRIDSGDLAALARQVRAIFDSANLRGVKIIGSGGLDEYDLTEFAATGTPFDSYGVGTKMGTSGDAPWSDISYKLVEYEDRPVLKLSTGKVSTPGRKQVFRSRDARGILERDIIGLRGEQLGGEPLLQPVMRSGKPIAPAPSLTASRNLFAADFKILPVEVKLLRNPGRYAVGLSSALTRLREEITKRPRN
jgi:nicotinate phosphoribosyltransferase